MKPQDRQRPTQESPRAPQEHSKSGQEQPFVLKKSWLNLSSSRIVAPGQELDIRVFDHKLPSPSPCAFSVLRSILFVHQLAEGGGLQAQRVLDPPPPAQHVGML